MGQDVCLIRSNENPRYLNYFLQSAAMEHQLAKVLVGSTFDRINVAEVKALTAVFPPKSEQNAIAEHLDSAFGEVDQTIGVAEREIGLIREYRTRLVADVVTGKFDVRDAARRLADHDSPEVEEAPDDSADEDTSNSIEIDEDIPEVADAES